MIRSPAAAQRSVRRAATPARTWCGISQNRLTSRRITTLSIVGYSGEVFLVAASSAALAVSATRGSESLAARVKVAIAPEAAGSTARNAQARSHGLTQE